MRWSRRDSLTGKALVFYIIDSGSILIILEGLQALPEVVPGHKTKSKQWAPLGDPQNQKKITK